MTQQYTWNVTSVSFLLSLTLNSLFNILFLCVSFGKLQIVEIWISYFISHTAQSIRIIHHTSGNEWMHVWFRHNGLWETKNEIYVHMIHVYWIMCKIVMNSYTKYIYIQSVRVRLLKTDEKLLCKNRTNHLILIKEGCCWLCTNSHSHITVMCMYGFCLCV